MAELLEDDLHLPAEHLTYILLDEWQKMADYSADRAAVSQPAWIEKGR